jgi:parvulin-like peptidyl-prolyl isomerase
MRVQLSGDYKGKELENKIQSMKLDLLDKLIEDRLILQEAKKSKLEPDQNRVKAKINELKSRYPSSREFEVSLLGQGLTEADIESRLKEQLLTYNIIDLKVKKKIVVNPIEVTDFYQKNIQDFVLPSQREFTYIMVNDIKLAQAISQELKNGQALGDLAKKNNLELDKLVVSQASGQLREDIEEAIFKLKIGEVSHVLAIQGNYYIFMFNSIIPSRQQTLAEVQEDIYQLLFNQKFKEELTQWLDELKKHSYIKIF